MNGKKLKIMAIKLMTKPEKTLTSAMRKFLLFIVLSIFFNLELSAMDKKPYHHIYKNGKLFGFRNLEGSPQRQSNFKWDWKVFREEKKSLK